MMVKYLVTSSYFYSFKSYDAELLLHNNKAEDEDKTTMKKNKRKHRHGAVGTDEFGINRFKLSKKQNVKCSQRVSAFTLPILLLLL